MNNRGIAESRIYDITKKIVYENFPEELEFFDTIWDTIQNYLSCYKDISVEKWSSKESQEKLISNLGFADSSQALDLITPVIIFCLKAPVEAIKDIGYAPRYEEIEKIAEKCALEFGAKGILITVIKRYLKDLCLVLPEILEQEKKEKEFVEIKKREEIDKEKPFARSWTPRTLSHKIGDIISKKDYKDIWARREETPLLIIKSGEIKFIYIYGKTQFLSPRKFDLLEYILKNRGQGGDIINLLDNVWEEKENANMLRQELRKSKEGQKVDLDLIREETSKITGTITKLNKFLLKYLNVEIRSNRKGQYGFNNFLEYCLVETTIEPRII